MGLKTMTDDQKYWYLYGYFESMIQNISIDMKLDENVVREWLVSKLENKIMKG